jgi:hypothetical protein
VNETFEFGFYIDEDLNIENEMIVKLSVAHQYRRNKKISYIIR